MRKFNLFGCENTLVKIGGKDKVVEVTHYKEDNGTAEVAFFAHPSRAWNYCLYFPKTNKAGKAIASKIVDAYTCAAIGRGDMSFNDAIKQITIN